MVELVVLILHQRDQRRHHERDAGELERRELVAQRLAGTGGHDRERVDTREDVADRERLTGAERGQAEPPLGELEHPRIGDRGLLSLAGICDFDLVVLFHDLGDFRVVELHGLDRIAGAAGELAGLVLTSASNSPPVWRRAFGHEP